jgi:integrase
MAPDMEAFTTFQAASGRWSKTSEKLLKRFDRYCIREYPDDAVLSQQMIDGWSKQLDTETNNSTYNRVIAIFSFLRYLRNRGKTSAVEPAIPHYTQSTYIPHAFTYDELRRFFEACDNLSPEPNNTSMVYQKITIPVFFRLLYSSGIRTNEARMLSVEDVNLDQGILNIRQSKGDSQHFVVLHDNMTELLQKYDEKIQRIIPNRYYFFSSPRGSYYRTNWVCVNFRKLWDRQNTTYATAYDFRHNYAIENINQWVGEGFNFDSKLLYLSKSMGHASLDSTRYYYSLVPVMSDINKNLSGKDFDDIVPEVYYD